MPEPRSESIEITINEGKSNFSFFVSWIMPNLDALVKIKINNKRRIEYHDDKITLLLPNGRVSAFKEYTKIIKINNQKVNFEHVKEIIENIK